MSFLSDNARLRAALTYLVPVALLLALFAVYRRPAQALAMDSQYSLLVAENLLKHGTFQLDRYFTLPINPHRYPGMDAVRNSVYPYHVYQYEGHTYYLYPPGSSILAIPLVAVLNSLGHSAVTKSGGYSVRGEVRMERRIASVIAAAACVFLYLAARFFLPIGPSLGIALAFAFGTSMWSTASRVLWTHTWGVFLLGLAIWLLARAEMAGRKLPRVLFATVLAWLCFMRPTYAISVACFCGYLLLFRRGDLLVVVAVGLAWLAALAAYSVAVSGSPVLPYWTVGASLYEGKTGGLEGIFGVLASPSRGLLVFSPFLVIAAWLPLRYRPQGTALRLTWLAAASFALHLLTIGLCSTWQGGYCYGPRYMTDFLPWIALLVIIGAQGWLDHLRTNSSALRSPMRWAGICAVGVLLAVSVFMHGRGVFSYDVWLWCVRPKWLATEPSRVWDWKFPQFAAGLVPWPDAPDQAPTATPWP